MNGAAPVIADDSGRVEVRKRLTDSAQVRVRRIGFREFNGTVVASRASHLDVVLEPLASTIDAVTVTARSDTPLARTGFYDRAERIRRGAIVGELLSPEEIDFRDAAAASRLLTGSRYVRIARSTLGRPILTGRGGCMMTLVVDGSRITGMIEELMSEPVPTSIDRRGTRQSSNRDERNLLDLDQVIGGREIMAVEIYPSTANAPAELQTLGGRGSCGMVVIWTGPRG